MVKGIAVLGTPLPQSRFRAHIPILLATAEATMRKLNSFKAKARALARSGYFYGLPPLEFELSFEDGFSEAREWLDHPTTREELERLCQESRSKHKAA
jgi:hypothetical protein